MSKADFIHLHTHSHYSLLEALPKVSELVAAAKADGQEALALTDNANLYGAIEFYKECSKQGIKPIIGVDFHVAPRSRTQKEHRVDDQTSRIVLLAKNETGYHNLIKLVSKAHLEGFYYKPRIDRELIEMHHEGLIAILPSYGGEHAHAIRHGSAARAEEVMHWHKRIFGDDCFAEITKHPEIPEHEGQMRDIAARAKGVVIPLVATHDVYYLKPEDALACDLVNRIRTGGVLDRDVREEPRDFSFRSSRVMCESFADMPDALESARMIAKRCELELHLGKAIFPTFPIPQGSTDDAELRALTEQGASEREIKLTPKLRERIDYELKIIADKGYASYFLIVADLLRHARKEGILTNTRGSAAGSLVSYLCGITTVDPIEFNMPFERFLNPERPSAPDIDMDIADNRRDELIAYAREKYGSDHVVQIGTFGTMMARAAVRDVSRALGHSYGTGDRIAKLIPFGKQGFPVTIHSALEETPELAEAHKSDADAREILELAQKIEGNARHVGVHAAGVVIAPSDITDFAPIQHDPKGGKTITQYDMYSIADEYGGVGLLKFDFLGLTNLSILANAVVRVRERLGVDVDLEKIPLNDKKVYEMLTRGETLGVFQMAGSGMTAYLKDLKPTVVHDLNAMVALYRPGPMAFIPEYIERKHNHSRVRYLDPRMEEILKPTYGILIYQDDVMMIAVQLAGYSWGEADKFRKAMGKKIPKEMAAQKEKLISGCIEHGMKKDVAQKLWEQIETFAAYGFNKAHAASYGNLAYKTAYMKANFPIDYMASLLTAAAGDVDKISEVAHECARMGLEILPPSVNESEGTFTVVPSDAKPRRGASDARRGEGGNGDVPKRTAMETQGPRNDAGDAHVRGAIRFGLYSIKNFGTGVADAIIAARKESGEFSGIADFIARVTDKNLNKKSLESLIQSGALDCLALPEGGRGQLLANIDLLLQFHREHMQAPNDHASLFELAPVQASLTLQDAPEASLEERLRSEKDLLGMYVSGHPLDKHKKKFADPKKSIRHAKENMVGAECVIAGFVDAARVNTTKRAERMGFFKLMDFSDTIELVAFPRVFKECEDIIRAGACVAVKGRISERNGELSMIVERAKVL
ncbi:MAG: DNA polymerase III subunit alpha [Patescibacteria group bacterium]|nr:DNA polymerase III subunit alpha [Patescibacteria group bacterium]